MIRRHFGLRFCMCTVGCARGTTTERGPATSLPFESAIELVDVIWHFFPALVMPAHEQWIEQRGYRKDDGSSMFYAAEGMRHFPERGWVHTWPSRSSRWKLASPSWLFHIIFFTLLPALLVRVTLHRAVLEQQETHLANVAVPQRGQTAWVDLDIRVGACLLLHSTRLDGT